MRHIFISHRGVPGDTHLARELRKQLISLGHSVFLDTESLRVGDEWAARITEELQRADALLLLLSGSAASSDMVIEEVRIARDLKRETGKPLILPVTVGGISRAALPYDLSAYVNRLQSAQWSACEDTPGLIAKLSEALTEETARDSKASDDGRAGLTDPDPEFATETLQPPGATYSKQWYVNRAVEERMARSYLVSPGSPVVLTGPQAIGKTWLLEHLLASEKRDEDVVAEVNIDAYDDVAFTTLNTLLEFIAFDMARLAGVDESEVELQWKHPIRTPTQKLKRVMDQHVLPRCRGRLFLALDRADVVGSHPYRNDFFRMLRSWAQSGGAPWDRFRLLLAISSDPSLLVTEVNSSPFNLCPQIAVGDFDHSQVSDLFRSHRLVPQDHDVSRVMSDVGGHPYLVRMALFRSRQAGENLEKLMQNAAAEDGPFNDHLRSRLLRLRANPVMANAVRNVLSNSATPLDFLVTDRLRSAGILAGRRGQYRFRYQVYREFFQAVL